MKHSKNQSFIEGKGFYIALCSCIAVLGLIAYMGSSMKKSDDLSRVSDNVIAEEPSPTPKLLTAAVTPVPTITAVKATPLPPKASPTPVAKAVKPAQTVPPAPPKKAAFIMPCEGKVIGTYSEDLAYNKTMDDWRTHNGIDIKADKGSDVKASCDGKIEEISADSLGSYIVISSDEYKLIYSNLDDESISLKVGDNVKSGDVIAKVGDTTIEEKSLEPHLHFEILKNSENIDPLSIIK